MLERTFRFIKRCLLCLISLKLHILLVALVPLNCVFAAKPLHIESPSLLKRYVDQLKFKAFRSNELTGIGQIWSITEDEYGYLWFGGARGVVRFDGINYRLYRHDPANKNSIPRGIIARILSTSTGKLWFATERGLYQYRRDKDDFEMQPLPPNITVLWDLHEAAQEGCLYLAYPGRGIGFFCQQSRIFKELPIIENHQEKDEQFYALHVDSAGALWIGSDRGLYKYRSGKGVIGKYKMIEPITKIQEDALGNVWVGTLDGLYRHNESDDALIRYEHDPKKPNTLSGNSVGDILLDREERLWIVLDGGGLNLYDSRIDGFLRLDSNEYKPGSLKTTSIRRGHVSKNNDIWLGFHPYGVAVSSKFSKYIDSFTYEPNNTNSLSSSTIHSLVHGADDELWVGTDKGINKIDLKQGTVIRLQELLKNAPVDIHKPVLSLMYDSVGRVWAGTWGGGLFLVDVANNTIKNYVHNSRDDKSISSDAVFSLMEIDENSILVAAGNGIEILNIPTGRFSKIPDYNSGVEKILDIDDKFSLIKDYHSLHLFDKTNHQLVESAHFSGFTSKILDIHKDNRGVLWLLTESGIYKQNNLFEPIQFVKSTLAEQNGFFEQLIEASQGWIWLGGSDGLTGMDLSSNFSKNINQHYGIPQGSYISPRATARLKDGRIVSGGTDGLVMLSPELTNQQQNPKKIVFTDLTINGQRVERYGGSSPIQLPINRSKEIYLSHSDKVISIGYSVLDFQNPENEGFSIQLLGFENKWRNVGSQKNATYTNLAPGNYTFRVKVNNLLPELDSEVASLSLIVRPPWWFSWQAYAVYFLVFGGILLLSFMAVRSHLLKEKERRINQRLLAMDRTKDEFLAYTSHELRTPLNGIIGIVDSILRDKRKAIPGDTAGKLEVVSSSGRRLACIINDILDFLKSKDHEISLKVEPVNLYELVNQVFSVFQVLAANKPINFRNMVPKDFDAVYLDRQRMTQVFYNLVGNALKFTESGDIIVSASLDGELINVCVSDSGCGISQEDIEAIFQPYQQASNQQCSSCVGSGIGLSITKKLIELHGGTISVESMLGKGTFFQFTLKNIGGDELLLNPTEGEWLCDLSQLTNQLNILLVDDDAVNRLIIQGHLESDKINITEVGTGQAALKVIGKEEFNIVLLDMFLPDISGIEVCQNIRKTHKAEQLPIVFLTGNSDSSSTSKCYEVGANNVLFKPVSKESLLQVVEKLIKIVNR